MRRNKVDLSKMPAHKAMCAGEGSFPYNLASHQTLPLWQGCVGLAVVTEGG